MKLTEPQLHILRHMLGVDDARKRIPPYRNYYCANPGDERLHELVGLGMVRMYADRDGYEWFTTTEVGRAAALASQRERFVPQTMAKRRYAAFLDLRDALPDLTFKQFLTDSEFEDVRARA